MIMWIHAFLQLVSHLFVFFIPTVQMMYFVCWGSSIVRAAKVTYLIGFSTFYCLNVQEVEALFLLKQEFISYILNQQCIKVDIFFIKECFSISIYFYFISFFV